MPPDFSLAAFLAFQLFLRLRTGPSTRGSIKFSIILVYFIFISKIFLYLVKPKTTKGIVMSDQNNKGYYDTAIAAKKLGLRYDQNTLRKLRHMGLKSEQVPGIAQHQWESDAVDALALKRKNTPVKSVPQKLFSQVEMFKPTSIVEVVAPNKKLEQVTAPRKHITIQKAADMFKVTRYALEQVIKQNSSWIVGKNGNAVVMSRETLPKIKEVLASGSVISKKQPVSKNESKKYTVNYPTVPGRGTFISADMDPDEVTEALKSLSTVSKKRAAQKTIPLMAHAMTGKTAFISKQGPEGVKALLRSILDLL
jgi:hypothetical protein